MITRADLHLVAMPLKFRFETSFGVQTDRLVPILELHDADGHIGVGEGVMDGDWPLYREEHVAGAMPLVQRILDELVVGRPFTTPHDLAARFAHVRGNRMAKAMIEMAAWDLWGRRLGQPIRDLIGGRGDAVATGVSLGIQPSIEATLEIVGRHVDLGYRRIKLKIKPGWDLAPLTAVRAEHPSLTMTADANSAYSLSDATHLRRIDAVGLDYIEQPLAWDDVLDHARLAQLVDTPICLDESIADARSARQAIEVGAARVINLKLGRVGGFAEAVAIDAIARASGVPLWCGGMLETGIGRAGNIHVATLPSFTKPGDISSASRYWEADLIEEPLETADGMMRVPAGPGTGVTLARDVLERFRRSVVSLTAG
jgi:O-succinylbenzoate synthase